MALEAALYTRLTAHAGTSAIVSTRVYPNVLPQRATLPAVTYRRISTNRPPAMGADSGVAEVRMQVDSWADSYSGVKALQAQVRSALQRYNATVGSEVILDAFIVNEMDLYEPEKNVHRVLTDFTIWHRET